MKAILDTYPKYKVDVIEEYHSLSGLGLSDDRLIERFDIVSETILSNVYMIIADSSILSFTRLIDRSPIIFNYHHIDDLGRIHVGNNILIKVL